MGKRALFLAIVAALLGAMLLCSCATSIAAIRYLPILMTRVGVATKHTSELPLFPTASLAVSSPSGNVLLQGGDDGYVQVETTKVAHSVTEAWARRIVDRTVVRTESDGYQAQIEVALPALLLAPDARVNLDLTAPRESNVTIMAKRGGIQVSKMEGAMRLATDEGDIAILDARTSLGCEASTTEGSITYRAAAPASPGQILLRTREGDIRVFLPADASFVLDAQTQKGRIRSGVALADAASGYIGLGDKGQWIKGRVRGATDVRLLLRAQVGDITVEIMD